MKSKLNLLHLYHIWTFFLLTTTGILLYLPFLRGLFSSVRLVLLWSHIALGIASILILIFYVPFLNYHWHRLDKRTNKAILIAFLIFLAGWSISGIILWAKNLISKDIVRYSLFIHDLLIWLGLPIILYHSLTHWKKTSVNKNSPSRRLFLHWLAGMAALIIVSYFTNISSFFSSLVQENSNCNKLEPLPKPMPKSNPPIGGGYKGDFRVYTIAQKPCFTNENWKFKVTGLVDRPLNYSWGDFIKIPRQVQVSDFHCVTGWTVSSVTYEGIPLSDLLKLAGVKSNGKFVKFISGDGEYSSALSLDQALMSGVMVAVLMDGKLIPRDYGGPARLFVPKMYTYKSVKWLTEIQLIDKPFLGYWETRGYENNAWVNGKQSKS